MCRCRGRLAESVSQLNSVHVGVGLSVVRRRLNDRRAGRDHSRLKHNLHVTRLFAGDRQDATSDELRCLKSSDAELIGEAVVLIQQADSFVPDREFEFSIEVTQHTFEAPN